MKRFYKHVSSNLLIIALMIIFTGCQKNNEEDQEEEGKTNNEVVIELFRKLDYILDSEEFKTYDSAEELKQAIENWLKKQAEVKSYKIDDNVIAFILTDDTESRIEFAEEADSNGDNNSVNLETEYVDANFFNHTQQNVVLTQQEQKNVVTKGEPSPKDYQPDYFFPVFWEPCSLEGIMDSPVIKKYYQKEGIPYHKSPARICQDTYCKLEYLFYFLTDTDKDRKPNLIVIATHGRDGNYLIMGAYENAEELKSSQRKYFSNITVRPVYKLIGKKNEHRCYVEVDAANLEKLLSGIKLTNAIVFLNACESVKTYDGYKLVHLFEEKEKFNAAFAYGYTSKVENGTAKSATDYILKCLLIGEKGYKGPLATSTAQLEANQAGYKNITYTGKVNYKFKYPIVVNKKLQTRSVAMYGCHIYFYEPNPGYSTSYCGLVYSTESSLPKIDDGKSEIVFTELDHVIDNGEDYFFSINNIIPNKQYYYRAFVCSLYEGKAYVNYAEEADPFIIEEETSDAVIEIKPYSGLTATTVTLSAVIQNAGNPPYSSCGFILNEKQNPENKTYYTDMEMTGIGEMSMLIDNLKPNMEYVAKAYTRCTEPSLKETYSESIEFTTEEEKAPNDILGTWNYTITTQNLEINPSFPQLLEGTVRITPDQDPRGGYGSYWSNPSYISIGYLIYQLAGSNVTFAYTKAIDPYATGREFKGVLNNTHTQISGTSLIIIPWHRPDDGTSGEYHMTGTFTMSKVSDRY